MADNCQESGRREDLMTVSARSGSNNSMEERKVKTRLSKEALKDMSLSERRFYLEDRKLVQESVVTRVYSIFGFPLLHNFHLVYQRF